MKARHIRFSVVVMAGLLGVLSVPANVGPSAGAKPVEPPAVSMLIRDQAYQLEIPQGPDGFTRGLMYRTRLAPDQGMIFNFGAPQEVAFWMKNCKIPLDMVFVEKGQVRHIVHAAPPCRQEPCPIYSSRHPVDTVIELAGGTAKKKGIRPGDPVTLLEWRTPAAGQ